MVYWTGEMTETLVRLWKDHSAGEIAKAMRITRSAVAGKLNRLRKAAGKLLEHALPPRPPCEKKKRKQAARRKRCALPKPPPPRFVPYHLERPCTLFELTSSRCHFPSGDPCSIDGFSFCGGDVVPGKPYCPHHCGIAFQHKEEGQQPCLSFKPPSTTTPSSTLPTRRRCRATSATRS